MQRLVMCSAMIMLSTSMLSAAELKSGLQPGEHASFFNVRDCTGPNAGKTLCLR